MSTTRRGRPARRRTTTVRGIGGVVVALLAVVLGVAAAAPAPALTAGDVSGLTPRIVSPQVAYGDVAPTQVLHFAFRLPAATGIVGYQYQWQQFFSGLPAGSDPFALPHTVHATGGRAQVDLVQPDSGYEQLWVRGFTADAHTTAAALFAFYAPVALPRVTFVRGVPVAGRTSTYVVSPPEGAPHVVAYQYTFGAPGDPGLAVHEVPATGSHTTLEVTIPSPSPSALRLTVRSVSANGYLSRSWLEQVRVDDSVWVKSDVYRSNEDAGGVGVRGSFTLVNRAPGARTITWSFDGEPFAAATIVGGQVVTSWTPSTAGDHVLDVAAVLPDGTRVAERMIIYGVSSPASA